MQFKPEECPLVTDAGWTYEDGKLKRDTSDVMLRTPEGLVPSNPKKVSENAHGACARCPSNILNGGTHLVDMLRSASQIAKLSVKVVEKE